MASSTFCLCLLVVFRSCLVGASSCPDAQDIFPCVCSLQEGALDMNCSDITSDEELSEVFQANFPTSAFSHLFIERNSRLRVLKSDSFGSASFKSIWITDTTLEVVESQALLGSRDTAFHLVFNFNQLVDFPFGDLEHFSRLTSLDLRHNRLEGFPQLTSSTLQVLYLSHNPLGSLPVTAFVSTPSLLDIHLSNCDIAELIPGTFSGLNQLRNVGLGRNQLTHLQANSIVCSPSTGLIDVGYNEISTVEPDVFPGLINGWIYIHHNHLRTLDEAVWRQPLVDGAYFDPYGNPLHCSCDVAWIMRDPALLGEVDVYTTCADGHRLMDLNVTDYVHC